MPGETASRVTRTTEAFTELAIGDPVCQPSSSTSRSARSPRRLRPGELQAFKDARGEVGATVNDVILAVAAAGLRRFLVGRGEELPEYLVALVPVSVRRPDEHLELGNRISTILVRLPIAVEDRAERLDLIRAETARIKQSEQARVASLIVEATGWTPPTINRLLSGALARQLSSTSWSRTSPGPR